MPGPTLEDPEHAAFGAAGYSRKPSELKEFWELGPVIRELALERGRC